MTVSTRAEGTYEQQFAILKENAKPAKGDTRWDKLRKEVMLEMVRRRHTFSYIANLLDCSYSSAYDWIMGTKNPRAEISETLRQVYLEK